MAYPGFVEGWMDHLGMHAMPYGRSKIRPLEKILADNPHPNKFYRSLLEETDELNQLKKNISVGEYDPTGTQVAAVDNFFEELFDKMGDKILKDSDPTDILKLFGNGRFYEDIVDADTYKVFRRLEKAYSPRTGRGKPVADALVGQARPGRVDGGVALSTKYKG